MSNRLENSIKIDGMLGKDAEFKYTTSGKCVIKFSICHNTSKKVNDQWEKVPHWFDCNYWHDSPSDKDILVKGQLVKVIGELRQESWEHEGSKRSKVVINVNEVIVLDKDTVYGKSGNVQSNQQVDSFVDDNPDIHF